MNVRHHALAAVAATLIASVAAEAQAPPRPAPAAAPAATTPATRVGVVDVQRVLARSAAGVTAREQLERERAVMQKELDGKRQELEKLREEIEKKGPLMTAETRREKEESYDRKRRDWARQSDDFRKDLEKKEQQLLQRVLREVYVVIDRLGKDGNYLLILERREAGVAFASASADVTNEIIRAYDQESTSKDKGDKGKR
ncbi:MAG: OmpH family outer membrane protein [Candidatus Rokubacteria bacterium]|nr:OmpH family outer membrane protein [Candidatus Rokubacteria bacterium]